MNKDLEKQLNKPFHHIDEVLDAFKLCMNYDEVENILDEIPRKFGDFSVVLIDEEENKYNPDHIFSEELPDKITGFRVTNIYSEYDDYAEDTYDFDWYEG